MSGPRTEAGRALIAALWDDHGVTIPARLVEMIEEQATRPSGDHIPWITVTLDDHSLACDCGWRERRNGPTWAEHIHAARPSGDEALRAALDYIADTAGRAIEEGVYITRMAAIENRARAALATPASSPDVEGLPSVESLTEAIEGQNLYHGRHGTVPAGRTTAMAILAALRDSRS